LRRDIQGPWLESGARILTFETPVAEWDRTRRGRICPLAMLLEEDMEMTTFSLSEKTRTCLPAIASGRWK
jgi:hypothetical protein